VSGKWRPGKPCGKFSLHPLVFLILSVKTVV
jgi:hypothetical protein